jgi:hypothetical protein
MPKPAHPKASAIESLKKELEGSTRHRPNPAPARPIHPKREGSPKTLSSEFFAKLESAKRDRDGSLSPDADSKHKSKNGAKDIDDMLRQILPSQTRKDIAEKGANKVEKEEKGSDDERQYTVHRYPFLTLSLLYSFSSLLFWLMNLNSPVPFSPSFELS